MYPPFGHEPRNRFAQTTLRLEGLGQAFFRAARLSGPGARSKTARTTADTSEDGIPDGIWALPPAPAHDWPAHDRPAHDQGKLRHAQSRTWPIPPVRADWRALEDSNL
jgi:hypothetical protein